MSQITPAIKYQVQQQVYDTNVTVLDEENFYNQKQGTPSVLTRKLTYMLGDYTKRFPLSTMTLGGIGYNENMANAATELDDVQYTYPVMGNIDKASVIGYCQYVGGDNIGKGNSHFFLYFEDNRIKRYYHIRSASGTLAYVLEDPTFENGMYKYRCQLSSGNQDSVLSLEEASIGHAWIGMFTGVPESQSRSTTTNMTVPGLFKNQMGFQRLGMSWAGNSANKIMKFNVKTDKGETNVWMDWFMYQFELEWMSMCEHSYWYSEYNRAIDGSISLKDLITGKVIPMGSGLFEQILNRTTYTKMTYNLLQNIIGDALYGIADADNMVITLWGGKGFLREIDNAMKEKSAQLLTDFTGVADKFVTGSNRDLMLGGFFGGFYHIDGYTVLTKWNPLMDHGKVAQAQRAAGMVHPETGFPLESYRGVALDNNDYDGEKNIVHVVQKGRAFLHGVIAGLTPAPKSVQFMQGYSDVSNEGKAGLISSEVDEGGYTRFRSCGVQLRRGNRSFDIQCVAGL